jgi:hypothetical protein
MHHRCLTALAVAIGLLAIGAIPASAGSVNITVSTKCSPCTYSITVFGSIDANITLTVHTTVTFTSQSGAVTSVNRDIPITGSNGSYSATVSDIASPVDCANTFGVSAQASLTFPSKTVNATFTGGLMGGCSAPPSVCTTGPQSLVYNVKENSNNASEIVWFNSHFKLQGTVPSSDFTVNVTNQTITFGPSTLAVPNAVITFSSQANCASTSFNTSTNEWDTFIPLAYATHADEIFSAGLAYILPSNFPQNVNNVAWNATFTSTAPSLHFQFQYGAANYLSQNNRGEVFPLTGGGQPDYNVMMIDPVHNAPTCNGYNGGDHAGTPENPQVKGLVTGGGSGGGGSNWTGSWSSTPTYICAAP